MRTEHPDSQLIRGSFVRMLFVNMFVMLTMSICGFVDSLVISNRLGTEALAAVGFFSPVSTAVGMFNMVVIGSQILIGNFIGAGKKDRIGTLFFSSFLVLACFYTLFAVTGIFFRDGLAALLGAGGEVHTMLSDYILGYLPGIPLQALTALLMAFVSFNNDMRRSYLSAGVMSVGNLVGDLLLAGSGTFGIGLATTLSYAIGFLILLPGYLKKEKTVHFERTVPDLRLVGKAVLRGFPVLMLTIGLVMKNTLMNSAISGASGDPGIAVVKVLVSVCDIVGIFTGGCSSAYSTLVGVFYGEQDRQSFCALFRTAAKIGFIICVLMMIVIMSASSLLTGLFFKPGFSAMGAARNMFLLGFTFLPMNILMNLLLSSYQAQGKMKLVNILSVAETTMVGLFAFLFVPVFGLDAAWLVNTVVDLICLGIVLASVWIRKGGFTLRTEDLLKLPDHFGAAPDELWECALRSRDRICETSESAVSFCLEKGISRRTASFAGLCIEEMARNIFQHGGHQEKDVHVDVRMVVQNELTIRIRDNCIAFDPRKRLDQFHPEDPGQNIGIRLTAGIARQIDWYNNAGVNTLIMKL